MLKLKFKKHASGFLDELEIEKNDASAARIAYASPAHMLIYGYDTEMVISIFMASRLHPDGWYNEIMVCYTTVGTGLEFTMIREEDHKPKTIAKAINKAIKELRS